MIRAGHSQSRPRGIRNRAIAMLAGILLLPGCVMGPDFHKPQLPAEAGYLRAGQSPTKLAGGDEADLHIIDQHFLVGKDVPARWWSLFHSPDIDRLVDQALAANPDLKTARAALRAAHALLGVQRATLYPQVDAGFTASRQRNSATLASPLNSNIEDFSLYTGQVSVSYAPDPFGGVQRQIEAVAAQAENQRYAVEAAYLSLTANVVVAAIQFAALRAQIQATEQVIAADSDIVAKFNIRKNLGEASRGDVALQETALAQAQATLPPLRKQLGQQEHLLAQLTGRTPAEFESLAIDLNTLTLPADLPLSLPSQIAEHRPDIRAAETNLHIAGAQLGVAIANRFPNFTLNASLGGTSTAIESLLSSGNPFWAVTAGITQPIFDAGALKNRQKVAEAQLEQAQSQYRSAVLGALQNVADTLLALEEDSAALIAQDNAARAARKSLDVARLNLSQGEGNAVALLTAEQSYAQALVGSSQARGARYADTAALFQALGGGWWNRTAAYANSDKVANGD